MNWSWWLETWDRQQEFLLPDREERFSFMFDLVEAVVGRPRALLDVAGGPGSITLRLRQRFPDVRVTLIDVDPSLLAIATGVMGSDSNVRVLRADLADLNWAAALSAGEYDAAITANSLHWLEEAALRRVYGDLAKLVRPGGVLCNADPMRPEGIDRLIAALEEQGEHRHASAPEGELDWGSWWKAAAGDPVLGSLVAERNRRFGGEIHPPEFTPPLRWHEEALLAAGFGEAGCVWRHGAAAIVAALR